MTRREELRARADVTVVDGVCPHDCPDTCAWQVAVGPDGRALDMWGHPEHPLTRGGLCGKVDRYLERSFHPERLTSPLRRTGPKGSGAFEPVSWDEALEVVGDRLAEVVRRDGAEAVLPYSYSGTLGVLQGEGMASRLFHALGASQLARTICAEAGSWGLRYTNGTTASMDPLDVEFAELVILWGTNTLTSNLHLWPVITRARKRGARVIVIDPVRTKTARAADQWIPIRPGTDAALALAMMHVLVRDGLCDTDFIERGTVGFEPLSERVESWTPSRAAEITGVPAEEIEALARGYAGARPAVIRLNYGMQRHRGGGMAVRTIACLPSLVGHWSRRGGGVLLSTSRAFELDYRGLHRPELAPNPPPRTLNMIRLGDALAGGAAGLGRAHYRPCPSDAPVEALGPGVGALVVYNANPAASTPDLARVREGLAREDLFTVVLEHFRTDTADYADIILPATTQVEHWDVHASYGHLFVSLNRPAVKPVGEARSNADIFRAIGRRLADRLGGTLATPGLFDDDDETLVRDFVEAQRAAPMASVSWDRLLSEGFVRLEVPSPYMPFAEGQFPTSSGRCELFSERLAADGYDPLPTFHPPGWMRDEEREPARSELAATGTLVCVSPPSHLYLNSTFVNVERLRAKTRATEVLMHPEDATARGLVDGVMVVVSNARGRLRLPLVVREEIVPGTVCIPGIDWPKRMPGGVGINELTPQDETDMGAGATFYDAEVEITAATPAGPGARR